MTKYALENEVSDSRLLHSDYDNLFKAIVTAGWNIKSDGDVEADTGSFALVEIPDNVHEMADMRDAVEPDGDLAAWPDSGWFVTSENTDGLIYVYEFRTQHDAEVAYDKLDDEYTAWCIDADADESDDGLSEHRYNSAPFCAKCGGPCEMDKNS